MFFIALLTAVNQQARAQTANFIANGASVKIVANGTVNLVLNDVNYKNNASSTHFSGGASIVKLIGVAPDTVKISSSGGFQTIFGNVVVNRTQGVKLLSPVSSLNLFTMTAGNVLTAASSLLTIGASSASPGTVSWTSGTVVGPMKRFFSGSVAPGQQAGIFPVGNNIYNRYAQLNFTSPNAVGSIIAEYISGQCPILNAGLPATVNGQLIQNFEDEGYWSISPAVTDDTAHYTLVLRGNNLSTPTTLVPLRIIKSKSHTTWDNTGIGAHQVPVGTNSDFLITNTNMTSFSWFDIGSSKAVPLPVALISFSANCEKDDIKLNWSTATEQNSQKFMIERSRELTLWEFVSEVQAAGNSSSVLTYEVTDKNSNASNIYYRLVQVDNDGNETIYGPISSFCGNATNDMIVFPNPSAGDFTVEILSDESIANAEIELLDISGKLIDVRKVDLASGKNHFYYDNLNLEMGTYLVRVKKMDKLFMPKRFVIYK